MYEIIRLVIAALTIAYTRKTHRILWQRINQKLDRAVPVMNDVIASNLAWMIGITFGVYLWPIIKTDLQKTFWYDIGWLTTVWLGGMASLSLVELFGLWLERKNQDKSK